MKNILLQGFLFDEKSSFKKGSSQAPPLIRKQFNSLSSNSFAENGCDTSALNIRDVGDVEIKDYFEIEKISKKYIEQGYSLITLGGDHSITFPIVRAYSQYYNDITIIHFDAHPDLYKVYQGDQYSHACPFYRIMEERLAINLYQFGIRTLNGEQAKNANKFGVNVNEMKNLNFWNLPSLNTPIYLSVDIDVLDPSFAPGVSHREPGGLSVRELINFIQQIEGKIVGADIVEYNPRLDIDNLTAIASAKLLKEIISKF